MIEQVSQTFDVKCDFCGVTEEITVKNWAELMAEMKQGGWVSYKDDGEWRHKCSGCRGK